MIDSKFRDSYQNFFISPLLKIPFLQRIDPTILTLFGLFFGLLIPVFLFLQLPFLALVCLALSGFFDTLDGSVARQIQKTSPQGAVLDITSDRIVEFMVILGLYLITPEERSLFCILMLGSILFCITSFLVVGIFSENNSEKGFFYSPGLIERAEAFAFFALMMLFPSAFIPLSFLFTALVMTTGIVRIYQFINSCGKNRSQKDAK